MRRGNVESRSQLSAIALLALTVTVGLECVRVLFPIAYSYRERAGLTTTALLLVAVFVTPVLAVPLVRLLGRDRALVLTVALVGAARLALQWTSPIPVGVAAVAAALGLLAITAAWCTAGVDGGTAVLAVVLGLTLDTALRSAWLTWDLPWHHGALATVVALLLVGALFGAAWLARGAPSVRDAAPSALLALGPLLALEVLFLQSPAFVASSGAMSLTAAAVTVLVADLVALGVLASPRASTAASWVTVTVAGVVLAVGAWWLTSMTDGAVALLVIVLQAVGVVLLASSARARSASASAAIAASAAAAGSLTFGLVVFLYQVHYDRPLPVSNRWLPVVAALVLGGAALRAALAHRSVTSITRRPRMLGVAAATVAVTSLVVGVGLLVTEPDVSASAAGRSLRVVTYNPHETVTRDGQLDPEAMAAAVEPLHPDVLVVEEAGRGWMLSSGIDLAEFLKRRLDLGYVWVPAADHQFGSVVFSRVPIHDARVVEIPHSDGAMRRSALVARVGPVDGRMITVIGTHLQNGSSAEHHRTRVQEVDAIVRAWGHAPRTVLLGDLNSDPGSPELHRLLASGFTSTQDTRHCTMHTSNDNCVDWIVVTPDLAQSRVRAVHVDTFDHRPVVADVSPR